MVIYQICICRYHPMDRQMIKNYLTSLIGRFYKILPIKESGDEFGEDSLTKYVGGLQREMLGCGALVEAIGHDELYLCLLATLQYLIDNKDCEIAVVKSEVFKSINICKKLIRKHVGEE